MKANAAQDLSSQQAKVMRELQQRIAAMAIERAEGELPNRLNDDIFSAAWWTPASPYWKEGSDDERFHDR